MPAIAFFRDHPQRGSVHGASPARWPLAGLTCLIAVFLVLANAYPAGDTSALLDDDIGIERSLAPDDDASAPGAVALVPETGGHGVVVGHPLLAFAPARAHIPDPFLVPYANGPPAVA